MTCCNSNSRWSSDRSILNVGFFSDTVSRVDLASRLKTVIIIKNTSSDICQLFPLKSISPSTPPPANPPSPLCAESAVCFIPCPNEPSGRRGRARSKTTDGALVDWFFIVAPRCDISDALNLLLPQKRQEWWICFTVCLRSTTRPETSCNARPTNRAELILVPWRRTEHVLLIPLADESIWWLTRN